MRATDARVAAVVHWVIRHLVSVDVFPDLLFLPVNEWIDLHQAPLIIPLDDSGVGSLKGLVLPDCGNPSPPSAQCFTQRFELSKSAAEIGIRSPQTFTELLRLLFGGDV